MEANNEPPIEGKGKFRDGAAEVLYSLSLENWCDEESGSAEAPTGWFGRISLTEDHTDDVNEALYGGSSLVSVRIVGYFLLREDNYGFVDVTSYETESELKAAYDELEAAYGEWLGGES